MKTIALIALLIAPNIIFAQKVEKLEGDAKKAATVKVYQLEMDWSDFKVKDYGTEEDIKEQIIAKFDAESEGSGEDWRAEWEEKKAKTYPSKFSRGFNKPLVKHGVMIATRSFEGEPDGKIVVKTDEIDLGVRKKRDFSDAHITATISFYNDNDELLLKLKLTDVPGAPSGSEWRTSTEWYATFERLREGYAKSGKMAGIYVYEKVFK